MIGDPTNVQIVVFLPTSVAELQHVTDLVTLWRVSM